MFSKSSARLVFLKNKCLYSGHELDRARIDIGEEVRREDNNGRDGGDEGDGRRFRQYTPSFVVIFPV